MPTLKIKITWYDVKTVSVLIVLLIPVSPWILASLIVTVLWWLLDKADDIIRFMGNTVESAHKWPLVDSYLNWIYKTISRIKK